MVHRRSLLAALGSAALAGCLGGHLPGGGESSPCENSVPEDVPSDTADCDARISQLEIEENLHTCTGKTVSGYAVVHGGACAQPLALDVYEGEGLESRIARLPPRSYADECDARELPPHGRGQFSGTLPQWIDNGDELVVLLLDGSGRIVEERSVVVEGPDVSGPENCG